MTGDDDTATTTSDPRLVRLAQAWDSLDEDQGQMNLLGLTLVVDGQTYSGLLVAGRVWAKYLHDLVKRSPGGPQQEALAGVFRDMESDFEAVGSEVEAGRYLHLVNVAAGLPNPGTQTTLLMRIRVADVSGWALGTAGQLPNFPYVPPPDQAAEAPPGS